MEKLSSSVALYYPAFQPSESWIKNSLLYWENISSIVPELHIEYSNNETLNLLRRERIYKHIDPADTLFKYGFDLAEEFILKVNEPEFKSKLNIDNQYVMMMSLGKSTYRVEAFLESNGWIIQRPERQMILVPGQIGVLYVSLLAKYVSMSDIEINLSPCTDLPEEEQMVFSGPAGTTKDSLQLVFQEILPTINPSVQVADLVEFRKIHQSEFRNFRLLIQEKVARLSECETIEELKAVGSAVRDELLVKSDEFDDLLKDFKADRVKSSLTLTSGLATPAIVKLAHQLLQLDGGVPTLIAGAVGGAALGAAVFLCYDEPRIRSIKRHPMSFVHSAMQAKIII